MGNEMAPELYSIWTEAKGYIDQGNYDKAIEIYKYVLIRYSDDDIAAEHAQAYLGDIFLTLRKLDLAEDHIKKAIGYKPEKPAYHYILGFTYSIKRQWDKAVTEFEVALAKEPDNGEYLRGLGWAIHSKGNKAKGLAYLHQASQLAPTNINILTDLAVAYLSAADFSNARKYAEKAVHIEPANALAQKVLKNVHNFEQAFKQQGKPAGKVRTTGLIYSNVPRIYRFKVSLNSKPNIWRIIEIKENQMLSSLHKAIFNAFDRFEEHLYSFFMSNKPYDRESEYTCPDPDMDETSRPVTRIRIDSLYLHPGQRFLYLFDYGDEWWHDVELMEIKAQTSQGKYPRIVKKQGKSPPQYPH